MKNDEKAFRLRYRKGLSRPGVAAMVTKSIASRIVHASSEYEARLKLIRALEREFSGFAVEVFFV
jgi:hypothetical protein